MEINLLHGNALDLADQAFMFKRTAREAALRHKMYATFMAKPHAKEPGSAMHIHQSIVDLKTGKNVFSGPDGTPTPLFFSHIAGLQRYLPMAMALLAPNVNSYRRITRFQVAPINVQWGYDNRTAGLRVPMSDAQSRRVENRLSGADANPYLAKAASLACGYLGMIEGSRRPTRSPAAPTTCRSRCRATSTRRSAPAARMRPADRDPRRGLRLGVHAGQGSRVRGVPAGDQLLGAGAPAPERVRRRA
jgi:glutamine synthetase